MYMHSLGKWKRELLHRPSHGVGFGSGRSFVWSKAAKG